MRDNIKQVAKDVKYLIATKSDVLSVEARIQNFINENNREIKREIERRRDLIISEPNGAVREQMISNLAIDF